MPNAFDEAPELMTGERFLVASDTQLRQCESLINVEFCCHTRARSGEVHEAQYRLVACQYSGEASFQTWLSELLIVKGPTYPSKPRFAVEKMTHGRCNRSRLGLPGAQDYLESWRFDDPRTVGFSVPDAQ